MNAAARLFIAKGIEATTVDEIVAGANVAKGTFYHHFTSKAEMILALRDRFSLRFMSRIHEAVEACAANDWAGRLRGWVRAAVEAYLADYRMHDIVFHDFHPNRRQSRELDAIIASLSGVLTAGAAAGAWRPGDTRLAATVLFHGLHGAVDDAIVAGDMDGARLGRALADMFLGMLAPGR